MIINEWYKLVAWHKCQYICKVKAKIYMHIYIYAYIHEIHKIHLNFLIILPNRLKIYRPNVFFFFTRKSMCSWKIGCTSKILRTQANLISKGRANIPNLCHYNLVWNQLLKNYSNSTTQCLCEWMFVFICPS